MLYVKNRINLNSALPTPPSKTLTNRLQVMSRYRLPGAATIPVLPTDGRVKVLAHLFEPCDALNTLALEYLATGPFDNYDEVITLIKQLLIDLKDTDSPSNTAWLLKILAAHPRLGEKRIDSEHSRLEQASLTAESEEEVIKLKTLNKQYEETFPGQYIALFCFIYRPPLPILKCLYWKLTNIASFRFEICVCYPSSSL